MNIKDYYRLQKTRPAVKKTPPGAMNKLESRFAAEILEPLQHDGSIRVYLFEALKLKLAKATYYTPDFMVIDADGEIIFYEVKGFWRDDARVKIKVAAEKFSYWEFIAVSRSKKGWIYEGFP